MPPCLKTPLILISAGSGLAPLRSFIKYRSTQPLNLLGPLISIQGYRTSKEIIYLDEMVSEATTGRITHLFYALSQEKAGSEMVVQHPRKVYTGLGHADLVEKWAEGDGYQKRERYCKHGINRVVQG